MTTTAENRLAATRPLGQVFAPAKINLALHVVGRRADGYHLLDSLVVFADVGDTLAASAGAPGFAIDGPFAAGLSAGADNLVRRAEQRFRERFPALPELTLRLEKHLPVSSGIGGGSADGAATLRLLAFLAGGVDGAALASLAGELGADGPMCLRSEPLRARGIGERLDDWGKLPALDLVLVNPGVAVSTPAVFNALARPDNPPLPEALPTFDNAAALASFLAETSRNDLATPAKTVAPQIAEAEAAVAASAGCLLARMSGSGATVFGLFGDGASARRAAAAIKAARPDWWVVATTTLAPGRAQPRGPAETVGH